MSLKPLKFVGSARKDISSFPDGLRQDFGHALFTVQEKGFPYGAKPLKGFGDSGVVELLENFDGGAYRCVHTTKIKDMIVVLHAFQKKSKSGIATPKHDLNLIASRLKEAEKELWT